MAVVWDNMKQRSQYGLLRRLAGRYSTVDLVTGGWMHSLFWSERYIEIILLFGHVWAVLWVPNVVRSRVFIGATWATHRTKLSQLLWKFLNCSNLYVEVLTVDDDSACSSEVGCCSILQVEVSTFFTTLNWVARAQNSIVNSTVPWSLKWTNEALDVSLFFRMQIVETKPSSLSIKINMFWRCGHVCGHHEKITFTDFFYSEQRIYFSSIHCPFQADQDM